MQYFLQSFCVSSKDDSCVKRADSSVSVFREVHAAQPAEILNTRILLLNAKAKLVIHQRWDISVIMPFIGLIMPVPVSKRCFVCNSLEKTIERSWIGEIQTISNFRNGIICIQQ